ncbi:hypothetical protein PIROE2DRAFT_14473 [Piromyces sp. E2]|nr:hypothetical protein PIROE2DRAFT_14473 [Piromyces sp. E2]|eukprot:OUM59888.1 hypothetical protein PIROE2DRAFT_14473 [Piromyces sp. E2]
MTEESFRINLRNSIFNNNLSLLRNGFYEWKITNWTSLLNVLSSPCFNICGHKWKIELYKNSSDNCVSLYLRNLDADKNSTIHVCARYILFIRNYNSYNGYKSNTALNYFNKNTCSWGWHNFINRNDLFTYNVITKRPLIELNRVIIGVYVRTYEYKRDQYIEEISKLIKNDNHQVIANDYYEWNIDDWNSIIFNKNSTIFELCGHKWKLELNKNFINDNISVYLKNENVKNDVSTHIYAKCVLTIRNTNDYSCFYVDGEPSFISYNKNNDSCGINYLLTKEKKLLEKVGKYNKVVINNNKAVVGVYIRTYKYEKEQYIEDIKKLIKDEGCKPLKEGYYEWSISNWRPSYYSSNNNCSPEFEICDHKWKLQSIQKYNGQVMLKLRNIDVELNDNTHIYAKCVLVLRNFYDYSCFYTEDDIKFDYYDENNSTYSWNNFIERDDLYDRYGYPSKSLVEFNKIIIGAYIRTYKYEKGYYALLYSGIILNMIINDGNEPLKDGFYEWKIENWNKLMNGEYSPTFEICNHKWNFNIYPNGYGNDNKGYVSYYLHSQDAQDEESVHINSKFIFFIRNYNDYSYFHTNYSCGDFNYINSNWGRGQFIKNDELLIKNDKYKKSIVENNKAVIGVYIRTYKYNEESYRNVIKSITQDEDHELINEGFYEWNILNWNNLYDGVYSSEFEIGGYKWKIQIFPTGNTLNNYISMNIKNMDVKNNHFIHVCAKCTLVIRNFDDYSCFYTYDGLFNNFSQRDNSYNVPLFINKNELYVKRGDTDKILIENNKTVIGVYIQIYKYNKDQYMKEMKDLVQNEGRIICNNDYYEWEIDYWNSSSNNLSPEFEACGYKWFVILHLF